MKQGLDWKQELLKICTILKNNGIDISNIKIRETINGKRICTNIKDIKFDNINEIIKSNSLDESWPIGKHIKNFREIYKDTNKSRLSDEEKRMAEDLGIVKKIPEDRQKPVFKGGKVSNFHINIIKENIDEILNGQLNNTEIMKLINERAIIEGETEIKDLTTIKRIVLIFLNNKPEDLKKYNEILKNNPGKRNLSIGKSDEFKGKSYHQGAVEFKKKIIDYYLPLYLSNKTSIETIKKDLHTSNSTIDKIIEEYYKNDEEGLEKYRKAKEDNYVATKEKREESKRMKEEVEKYKIVSTAEFKLLSEEKQDKQIIMKTRKKRLDIDKKKGVYKSFSTEKTTIQNVNKIKDYFRKKNSAEKINFSEQDIRYVIFMNTSLVGRKEESLDRKINKLASYGISKENIYGIIKTYPGILGSSIERIENQLEMLKKVNLIDSIVSNPRILMISPQLMYALIKYAKERYKIDNLSGIEPRNIFMSNSTIKKRYGITHEEIKEIFPYDEMKGNVKCIINAQTIGQALFNSEVEMCDNMQKVLNNIMETIIINSK